MRPIDGPGHEGCPGPARHPEGAAPDREREHAEREVDGSLGELARAAAPGEDDDPVDGVIDPDADGE